MLPRPGRVTPPVQGRDSGWSQHPAPVAGAGRKFASMPRASCAAGTPCRPPGSITLKRESWRSSVLAAAPRTALAPKPARPALRRCRRRSPPPPRARTLQAPAPPWSRRRLPTAPSPAPRTAAVGRCRRCRRPSSAAPRRQRPRRRGLRRRLPLLSPKHLWRRPRRWLCHLHRHRHRRHFPLRPHRRHCRHPSPNRPLHRRSHNRRSPRSRPRLTHRSRRSHPPAR